MANVTIKFLVLLTISACTVWGERPKTCGVFHTNGYTSPLGDIILRYGDSLDINCTYMERKNQNKSKEMTFQMGKNNVLPKELITRIDSSTIRLHIDKPQIQKEMYYCKDITDKNSMFICQNLVIVDVPPRNVTDLSCLGRNFENMTCSWIAPPTYLEVDYKLELTVAKTKYNCNLEPPEELKDGRIRYSTFFNVSTLVPYRMGREIFTLSLTASNKLGSHTFTNEFVQYSRVVPNPMENLSIDFKGKNQVNLTWTVPYSMQAFPKKLVYRIFYQWEGEKSIWHSVPIDSHNTPMNKVQWQLIRNLNYPHRLCDLRISSRSEDADPNDPILWSQNASITFRMQDELPKRPPETTAGSYRIDGKMANRDITIYWKQLDTYEDYGDNLTYLVKVVGEDDVKPSKLTSAYAIFTNLHNDKEYKFRIWSVNNLGRSLKHSQLTVKEGGSKWNQKFLRIQDSLKFIKMALEGELYGLSWSIPPNITVNNFTLFWCVQGKDPYICSGELDWVTVPSTETSYNLTLTRNAPYQFAMSVNTPEFTSGMVWAECTVVPNKTITKLATVGVGSVGSTFIEIKWQLDCPNRKTPVIGFNIYYYPIVNGSNSPQSVKRVRGDESLTHGNITNLKPYTVYRVAVAVLSDSGESQLSKFIEYTTSEDSPSSPPTNIRLDTITNSSLTISWDKPKEMNGHLKYYRLICEECPSRDQRVDPDKLSHILSDLESHQNFTITMEACTVSCSGRSKPLLATTTMSYPGFIQQPRSEFTNETFIRISWDRPVPPRGLVDFYEIRFRPSNLGSYKNYTGWNLTVKTNHYDLDDCGDNDRYKSIYFSVRAVNLINNQTFPGPWSSDLETICKIPYVSYSFLIIIVSVGMFMVLAFFGFRKLYSSYKIMRNVEVKLPPGLASGGLEWPLDKKQDCDIICHNSAADEELLLNKIPDVRHSRLGVDSSGCSSGQESVSSSLESGAHLSPCDSGTHLSGCDSGGEQSRTLSNDELHKNSLRKRNISATRSPGKGYVIMPTDLAGWSAKAAPASPGAAPVNTGSSYCMLGVDPTSLTSESNVGKSYVTLPLPAMSLSLDIDKNPELGSQTTVSPYLKACDLKKTPNPGYIPFNTTESQPEPQKSGYVVAGVDFST